MSTIIKWIEDWFKNQCDGNWEHSNRILIESLDNPGWSIQIDLADTLVSELNIEYNLFETNDNDWYGFSVKDSLFHAIGDPYKLEFLLRKFKELIESGNIT